ncbi:MAG: S-methyl-5-thioribose-1-phosphate isomerase, partial [Salinisphaera sp.]|nr:S-methyl-5-thioribose-1-phosphate isomerase [Salinisphaera sp.]
MTVQDLESLALRMVDGRLELLDQTGLPTEQRWLACAAVDDVLDAIGRLAVRGAPLIGVAAALLVAVRAQAGDGRAELEQAIVRLRAARPTAVNLAHAMDRLRRALQADDWHGRLVGEALAIFKEDVALCDAIAEHGAALIAPGERILTHCNTGGLATAGVGTALGVIRRAHDQGKNPQVWVDETRPLLQGGRLTAWELEQLDIPYRLIVDSAAAAVMAAGECDRIIVGADRIAANGDFANKIGTYSLAVLAAHHDIPFFVAAPATTVDAACANGAAIPIEQRAAEEVHGVSGSVGSLRWSPTGAPVHNPAFDVTPAALVSGWILDSGVYDGRQVVAGAH